MAKQARLAYGTSANIQAALENGVIDAYDILFLDGDTEPKIGWVNNNGCIRIVESPVQVVTVTELPVAGDENVIYIYNDEAYIWNGAECVAIGKPTDISALEADITAIKEVVATKVDEVTVDNKINEAIGYAIIEVVEF